MKGKISIIVPIYKVEKELDRCVQSLLKQTYRNIEIILVDDGSPDRCPAFCDQYALEDSRVCVIHKENGGLSDARNAGLKKATGEYILYVDSDDYIELDSCERLINASNRGRADIVVGNAIMEKPDGCEMMVHTAIPAGQVYDAKEFTKKAICAYQWYAPAWLNMYRREYLLQNGLYFKKGIYFEDVQMLPRVFLPAKQITCIEGIFYHYVIRGNSIMTSEKDEKKKRDSIQILKEWKAYFDTVEDLELQRYLYGMLLKCYLHECRTYRITKWEIEGLNIKFVLAYGLNSIEKIKYMIWIMAPYVYLKMKK